MPSLRGVLRNLQVGCVRQLPSCSTREVPGNHRPLCILNAKSGSLVAVVHALAGCRLLTCEIAGRGQIWYLWRKGGVAMSKSVHVRDPELIRALEEGADYLVVGGRRFLLVEVDDSNDTEPYNVTDPEEVALIREALQDNSPRLNVTKAVASPGAQYKATTAILAAEGCSKPGRGAWSESTGARILSNPNYVGVLVHGKRMTLAEGRQVKSKQPLLIREDVAPALITSICRGLPCRSRHRKRRNRNTGSLHWLWSTR